MGNKSINIMIESLLLWTMLCVVLQIIFMSTHITDRHPILIKLPTPKRFKGKLTPIYKVTTDHCFGKKYAIEKWEIMYTGEIWVNIINFILPYPVIFKIQRYKHVGTFPCVSLLEDITEDISIMYERLYEDHMLIYNTSLNSEKSKKDKLNQINKTFNENYIK